MYYNKQEFPQEGDLVVCTATKILPTSVFVKLDYHNGRSGILHISEIAPGRIRNLNEYVSEGKTLVLQVLKVNRERGHIDLSLRRVSDARKAKKLSEMKQELKAEKIIDAAAESLKIKPEELYQEVARAFAEYEYLFKYFMAIVKGEDSIDRLELPKKNAQVLLDIIKQRIKPPIVEIAGIFKLKNFSGDGLSVVKNVVLQAQAVDTKALSIKYGGGGTYPFIIQHSTFDDAESILKKALTVFEDAAKDKLTVFSFERREGVQVEQ